MYYGLPFILPTVDQISPQPNTCTSRSFASIGPTLCNALSPSVPSTFLSGILSSSFAFIKTYFFTWGLTHRHCQAALLDGSRSTIQMLKYNTIQYNTIHEIAS